MRSRSRRKPTSTVFPSSKTFKAAEVVGTREYLGNDYLKRAVAAKLGRFAESKEESLYSLYLTDAAGKPLDASQTSYTLKLGKDELPPVNAFWSITMYDGESQSLVENPINRYQISSEMLPTLSKDEAGDVTLHIQHESPDEEQAAGWLPAPKGPFYLVMRLYWPKPAALDGSWVPPLVWAVESASTTAVPKPPGAESAEDFIDATAGAYPVDVRRPTMRRLAWVFELYAEARSSGRIGRMRSEDMRSLIEQTADRITLLCDGKAGEVTLESEYEEIGGGSRWRMIREHGPFARTRLYAEGVRAFVAVRERGDECYENTVGRMSPFINFPILQIYDLLNEAEGTATANDRWGGSDTIGGSPRLQGSRLSPAVVEEIVEAAINATG